MTVRVDHNRSGIHLLTHTSGLINSLAPDHKAVRERLYHTRNDIIDYLQDTELCFEPGTEFQYSNFGYSLLAIITERVVWPIKKFPLAHAE